MKKNVLVLGLFALGMNAQEFDNLTAKYGTGKTITWFTSDYGNGFGHRILNLDPGGKTLLNFQGRHNSSVWKNILTLTSNGLLGIGTDNPRSLLEVNSRTSGDAVLRLEADINNSNESNNPRIEMYQDGAKHGAFIGFDETWGGTQADNIFRIGTRSGSKNNYNNLTITPSNGRIGIGTDNPRSLLEVNAKTSGDAVLRLEADVNNSNESHNPRIEMYQDGALHGAFIGFDDTWGGDQPDNLFRIGTRSGGENDNDNITINAFNGNVGIGTNDTKGYKLGVNGKIAATEVKVALYQNWPDYVFTSEYNLPTLEEVENHIKEKGHLKNIPSATEVEQNGIFLGEINAKLLEKIEELTLYTIAQEKELKAQKAKNQSLEQRLEKLEKILTNK